MRADPRLTQADLAARFHTTQSTVSRVLAGRLFAQQPQRKLTEEQVQEVRLAGASGGWAREQVTEKYGLTKSEVTAIIQGKTYRDVPLSDQEIERRISLMSLAVSHDAMMAAIPFA